MDTVNTDPQPVGNLCKNVHRQPVVLFSNFNSQEFGN